MATPLDADSSWPLTPEQAEWARYLFPELALTQRGSMFEFSAPKPVADEIFTRIQASLQGQQGQGLEERVQEVPAHQQPAQPTWQAPQAYDPRPQPQPQAQPQWQPPQQASPPVQQWPQPAATDEYYARERAQGERDPGRRQLIRDLAILGGAALFGGGLVGAVASGLIKFGSSLPNADSVTRTNNGPEITAIYEDNVPGSQSASALYIKTRRTGTTSNFELQAQFDGIKLKVEEMSADQNLNPKVYYAELSDSIALGVHRISIVAKDRAGITTASGDLGMSSAGMGTLIYADGGLRAGINPATASPNLLEYVAKITSSDLRFGNSFTGNQLGFERGQVFIRPELLVFRDRSARHTMVWSFKYGGKAYKSPPITFTPENL